MPMNVLFKEKSCCCSLFQVNTKGKCLRDSRDKSDDFEWSDIDDDALLGERMSPVSHWGRQLSCARDCGVTHTC